MVPKYNIDDYAHYYYRSDFADLRQKMTETAGELRKKRLLEEKGEKKEIRGFLPYKVAKRLKEAITFSVKLNGRCHDLNIDENTKMALERIDIENYRREKDGLKQLSINNFDLETSEPPMKILMK